MLNRRSLFAALFGAVAAAPLIAVTVATEAEATPGMVDARGCHSRHRHCHSPGELRTNSRGRRYKPGAFGKRGRRRARGRRRGRR